MSSGYLEQPRCPTCRDSPLASYCSNCKRTRCPKCGERGDVSDVTGIVDDIVGEMCRDCFKSAVRARCAEAKDDCDA